MIRNIFNIIDTTFNFLTDNSDSDIIAGDDFHESLMHFLDLETEINATRCRMIKSCETEITLADKQSPVGLEAALFTVVVPSSLAFLASLLV
jgi:hypothetical protein